MNVGSTWGSTRIVGQASRMAAGQQGRGFMATSREGLGLAFGDVLDSLDESRGRTVPLERLIEELCAGSRPTQELFQELVCALNSGDLEICDDEPSVRLRDAALGKRASFQGRPTHPLSMGDLAVLSAVFARVADAYAAKVKASKTRRVGPFSRRWTQKRF